MRSTVVDENGVAMAGPDDPALVRAEARAGHDVRAFGDVLLGASVGGVAPAQAGIVPAGRARVSDEMVMRCCQAVPEASTAVVRRILEAALRG